MRAVWIEQGQATVTSRPMPTAGTGEALLGLRVAALSPWDLQLPTGFAGTPGVTAVATVLEAAEPSLVGRRVTLRHPVSCGVCRRCHTLQPHLCALPRSVYAGHLPGALAEFFTWPTKDLVVIPDGVRDYDAALVHGVARTRPALAQAIASGRLLVLGRGALAPIAALTLRNRQVDVYLGPGTEGAAHRFNRFGVGNDPGGRFPLVLAIIQQPEELAEALLRVTPGGTLLVDPVAAVLPAQDLSRALRSQVTIQALPAPDYAEALSRLKLKEVCEGLSKVREECFPLQRADDALNFAKRQGTLQILVENS